MNQVYPAESRQHIPEPVQRNVQQRPQFLSLLALFAIVSTSILLASAWLLPFASEYSIIGDNISELVLGRFGFIQTVAFVLSGIGTLGLAWVIYQLTRGCGARKWALAWSLSLA